MHRTSLIVKTYEKGQKQPSIHSCTELSKTQLFPVNIVNSLTRLKQDTNKKINKT